MQIRQFVDEGLGNSTHLVISERTGLAALIDPLRDVDCYLDVAAAAGARISHVLETHIHNDFISGSRELAQRVGARIVASARADLAFEYHGLSHDETLSVGDMQLRALETPGHTPEHVSYLAREVGTPERPAVLFSGGSLLVGAVARTDLLGHEHAVGLGRQLFESLHAGILRLPDDTEVYPTHGAGSFCTAATVEQVRQRLERGEPLLVLDIRQDAEWREGHIPGAQHIEAGALATAGITLPRDWPIATHCEHEQRSATALSLLERQGYTDLHLIDGGWSAWQTAGYPITAPVGVDQR